MGHAASASCLLPKRATGSLRCTFVDHRPNFNYNGDDDNYLRIPMTIELVALIGALAVIGLVFVYALISGSPPTPTSPRVLTAAMRLLPRRLPGEQPGLIFELGSGWYGMSPALAHAFPEHSVIGIEVSPLPWLVSNLIASFKRNGNLSFERDDFMRRDLSDAALVVCYLAGMQMKRLEAKLRAELQPGALVLAHTFAMPGWQPLDRVYADDIYRSPVYLYEVPPEVSGAVAPASQTATESSTSGES